MVVIVWSGGFNDCWTLHYVEADSPEQVTEFLRQQPKDWRGLHRAQVIGTAPSIAWNSAAEDAEVKTVSFKEWCDDALKWGV
jgi:hypothetical protein